MRSRDFWAFMTPFLFLFLVFGIGPLVVCIIISFTHFSLSDYATSGIGFAGFANYLAVLASPRFWRAMSFTLFYVCTTVPLELCLGFAVALLLNARIKLRGVFSGALLLPYVLTPVVAAMAFSWLFRDQWGYVSYLLGQIGIHLDWFNNPWPARFLFVIFAVWKFTPFVILILFAGLKSLPREPLEAASIDGASWSQRVFFIIIPLLRHLFIFVILTRMIDAFKLFDEVFVMTGGGPGSATQTIVYYDYVQTFRYMDLGRGTAVGVLSVLALMIIGTPLLYYVYRGQLRRN